MMMERKTYIAPGDVVGFELTCGCGTAVAIPAPKAIAQMPAQCPVCGGALHARGAAENDAVIKAAQALGELAEQCAKAGLRLRIEVRGLPDDRRL